MVSHPPPSAPWRSGSGEARRGVASRGPPFICSVSCLPSGSGLTGRGKAYDSLFHTRDSELGSSAMVGGGGGQGSSTVRGDLVLGHEGGTGSSDCVRATQSGQVQVSWLGAGVGVGRTPRGGSLGRCCLWRNCLRTEWIVPTFRQPLSGLHPQEPPLQFEENYFLKVKLF